MTKRPTPRQMEVAWHVIDDLTNYLIDRDRDYIAVAHWGALVEAKRRVAMTMDMFASEGLSGYRESWNHVLGLDGDG